MDLEGNQITATMYDTNITALEDQLKLGKTYMVSNATVKDNKGQFRSSQEDKIWTITGKTKIEELNEDNLNFLFAKYELTPFDELEKHMDKNANINVIGVAIDIRQKRIIQTHFGKEACLQDIILIDKQFRTVMLTLWDTFVERECTTILQNLAMKPVIWATNLKVSSFNGITLSTKMNSNLFIDAEVIAVTDYKQWVRTNKDKLDELTEHKPFVAISPPKLSPPPENKFTPIADLLGNYLAKNFYWVKAHWRVISTQQKFWYMSCNNCKKTSNADLGKIHKCRFCKYEHAKAMPRANAFLHLEDTSGWLDAGIIGEIAETLLEATATEIMNSSQKDTDGQLNTCMKTESEEELIFYLKVTQKRQNPPEYRYDVIFVFNSLASITDVNSSIAITTMSPTTSISHIKNSTEISDSDNDNDSSDKKDAKGKNKMCNTATQVSTDTKEFTTKRALFQILDETTETDSNARKKTNKGYKSDEQTKPLASKKEQK